MKLKIILFISILILFLVSHLHSENNTDKSGPKIYLNIKKPFRNYKGKDYLSFKDSMKSFILENSFDSSFNENKFTSYEIEFGLETKKYSIGLSIGKLDKDFNSTYSIIDTENQTSEVTELLTEFKCTPIILYNKLTFLNTKYIKSQLSIGWGGYIGKFSYKRNQKFTNSKYSERYLSVESTKTAPAFHIGLNIELKPLKFLSITIEPLYRIVNFTKFKSKIDTIDDDQKSSTESTMYLIKSEENGSMQFWGKTFLTQYWTGEEASFSLNGFTLNIGLKISI